MSDDWRRSNVRESVAGGRRRQQTDLREGQDMSRQFLVERHACDRARTLARVGHWLLPWICILILSSTIAHATEQGLTESTSVTTGAACVPNFNTPTPPAALHPPRMPPDHPP